jgi:hypothetical protein
MQFSEELKVSNSAMLVGRGCSLLHSAQGIYTNNTQYVPYLQAYLLFEQVYTEVRRVEQPSSPHALTHVFRLPST